MTNSVQNKSVGRAYGKIYRTVLEAYYRGKTQVSFPSISGWELKALKKLLYNGVCEELGRARGDLQEDGTYMYAYKINVLNVKAKMKSWNGSAFEGELVDVIPQNIRQQVYFDVHNIEV